MLQNLHVKNLALIQEADLDFHKGLHILTGETGAGKSLLIGSVNLALGAKASADMIRNHAEYALIELVFQIENPSALQKLRELDIPMEEDGQLILQRKIQTGRSISKINGETVTASTLKEISELLIDIHGQQEHQSLLYRKNHRGILDEFAGSSLKSVLSEIHLAYLAYQRCEKAIREQTIDEKEREREISLLQHETEEIEAAHLKEGEDEKLEETYHRMVNAKKIMESMNIVYQNTGYESGAGAGESVGRALRELKGIVEFDQRLQDLEAGLNDIDNLINDFNRSTADYMEQMNFLPEEFEETQSRLNTINHLKDRYGDSIHEIEEYFEKQSDRLLKYQDYDIYMEKLQTEYKNAKNRLEELSGKASQVRQTAAKALADKMETALRDLNFLSVSFQIKILRAKEYSAIGFDEVEFLISTNPGEPLKPLSEVASGGELSRIMLALKTVIADKDEIDTLIFDEIDTGISGRTAQRVAEKLAELSKTHQVICITHLAQIAAASDHHFLIDKREKDGTTITTIDEIKEEEIIEELARILGGTEITETVRQNAAEMRKLAKKS